MFPLYRLSLQRGHVTIGSKLALERGMVATAGSGCAVSSNNPITLRLFDCDANLTHEHLRDDVVDLLSIASSKGALRAAIVPTSHEKDSAEALSLALNSTIRKESGVAIFATYGVHPYYARGENVPESFIANCKNALLNNPGIVVAIGECGLDMSEGFPPLIDQLCWFRKQLDLACELQKPLFLHERNAHDVFVRELEERKNRLPKKLLVHCFTGTEKELRKYLDFGCYVSISGLICRADKEGKRFRDVIRAVNPPPDRLLLETDAPYMQFPGCRRLAKDNAWKAYPNVPASIIQVAEATARALDKSLEHVCADSFQATEDFFGVKI